jgi:hypothetical protein
MLHVNKEQAAKRPVHEAHKNQTRYVPKTPGLQEGTLSLPNERDDDKSCHPARQVTGANAMLRMG